MSAKAIKEYGLEKEYHIGGATIVSARRATFLIDKEGKIIEEQVPQKIVDICQLKRTGEVREKPLVMSERLLKHPRSTPI